MLVSTDTFGVSAAVQPELFTQVGAGTCSPRRRTGLRPRGPHRRGLFGPDPVQDPPRGRHRGHRTEQILPIGQHADAADRVRAIGYCHREIGEYPPRRMSRQPLQVPIKASATPSTRPVYSAISHNRTTPACDTTPCPCALTTTRRTPLATLHLRSAFHLTILGPSNSPRIPSRTGGPHHGHRPPWMPGGRCSGIPSGPFLAIPAGTVRITNRVGAPSCTPYAYRSWTV